MIKFCREDMNMSDSRIMDIIMSRFSLNRSEAERLLKEALASVSENA